MEWGVTVCFPCSLAVCLTPPIVCQAFSLACWIEPKHICSTFGHNQAAYQPTCLPMESQIKFFFCIFDFVQFAAALRWCIEHHFSASVKTEPQSARSTRICLSEPTMSSLTHLGRHKTSKPWRNCTNCCWQRASPQTSSRTTQCCLLSARQAALPRWTASSIRCCKIMQPPGGWSENPHPRP